MRYVIDDNGYEWYYDTDTAHIRCVGSEVETSQDGYFCWNLEDGVELLIEYGYITPEKGKVKYLDK